MANLCLTPKMSMVLQSSSVKGKLLIHQMTATKATKTAIIAAIP